MNKQNYGFVACLCAMYEAFVDGLRALVEPDYAKKIRDEMDQ